MFLDDMRSDSGRSGKRRCDCVCPLVASLYPAFPVESVPYAKFEQAWLEKTGSGSKDICSLLTRGSWFRASLCPISVDGILAALMGGAS